MDWKIALAQHPMYFLIKEDTLCAERTPPWGAQSIEEYVDRVKQNLATLRQCPELKIGYEWSGLELELLAQDAPEVFQEMCALAQEGQIAFYNGTYSQPHLQTLSSESNYRQFEHGMRVYQEMCDRPVRTYAHQEASVHDQVPQLLQAFGIKYGILPGGFFSTLVWLDGGEIILRGSQPYFAQGSEFAAWRGLDGTEIPLYLRTYHQANLKDWVTHRVVYGQLRVPPIILANPDMISIDEDWLARHKGVELVLLDDVLGEELKAHPPQSKVRHFCNWSYIEGIRAEELSRSDWQAEVSSLRAEALNALAYALLGRPADCTERIWKTILATQHHDVYCFCGPEIRDKSIGWLQEAAHDAMRMADDAAQAIVAHINCEEQAGQPLVVFRTTPHTQESVVMFETAVENPMIVNERGQSIPSESVPGEDGSGRVRFLADMPGLGFATYSVREGGECAVESEIDGPLNFENAHYRVTIHPDGTFTSLVAKPSGYELLDPATVCGNQLAAIDSTGLSPKRARTGSDRTKERWWETMARWQPPRPGPELRWEPTAPPRIRRSPLGVTLTIPGKMGSKVEATLMVALYRELARIDLSWTFMFDTASIGIFYDDNSKLRIQWPLSFDGDIHHDIPFGVVQTRQERPFFPVSWVDVSDGEIGLAYFHQGTPKHWVSNRTLVNLFAWGEDTDAIGNRMGSNLWLKSFDQRLRGSHTIHCALYPHTGDWRSADVIGAARSYGSPPVAYLADAHGGELPASLEVLTLKDPELVSTAVKVEGTDIVCRLYSVAEKTVNAEASMQGLQLAGFRTINGEEITQLQPFQIGELILKPQR